MQDLNIVFAGFGGQGILFSGKVAAYAGLIDNKEISWLPSYGPEMRGGTANCSVCISDTPIGSPLVTNPNVLIAMNLPSLDVRVFYVPATKLAEENGLKGLANIILLGKLYKECPFCEEETIEKALLKCIPPKKAAMLDFNKKAIAIGRNQ